MRILALGGVVGPVMFLLAVLVVAQSVPGYSHLHQFISELGAAGATNASFMNYVGFVPTGILLAGFGVALGQLLPRDRAVQVASALAMLSGVGISVAGIFSCDAGCPQTGGSTENFVHNTIAPPTFLCLIVATGILGFHLRSRPSWRTFAVYSGVTCVVALGLLVALATSLDARDLTGLWQRLMLAMLFSWTAVLGVRLFAAAGKER